MANVNVNVPIKTIGMDLVPPYAVYVNNAMVAEYESEQAAANHYEKLRLQAEKQKNH